ncbi:MAG: PH domain-containing protein [Acidimicrobiales bacterium]
MSALRRRREEDIYAGSLEPVYPQPAPDPYSGRGRTPVPEGREREREQTDDELIVERPPSVARGLGQRLSDWRKRALPLPDEVIDQYLGNGERMIHTDHPSFASFVAENTLLFIGMFAAAALFLGIAFNGSLLASGVILLILSIVMLILVLRRLGERYTSYVVTDVHIMRISGIVTRRAHSIPWVRVTDLTFEQGFTARLLGFATLHIESANEDSGLRNLEGVSDPMKFNQYVVDMVVAKQGATAPVWEQLGEPAPVIASTRRGLRDRLRLSRRRRVLPLADTDPRAARRRERRASAGPVGSDEAYGDEATRRSPVPGSPQQPLYGAELDDGTGSDDRTSRGDGPEADLPWGG